jgi:hypothetical protein
MENPEKNWQHWGHKTEDELKQTKTQSKKYNPENLNGEQHGSHQEPELSTGTQEGQSVAAYYTTPTMLLI